MSRLRALKHLLTAPTGGGGGSSAATYYALMGTDLTTAAATGWMTFGLNSGNRRVWVDSISGSDSNSGLSAALAKQTWDAAFALWIAGTAGDQLMVAGTGGRTYTDTGASNMTFFGGISPTYPVAVLSYDPADAANSAKYGKLTGSNMPKVNLPDPATAPPAHPYPSLYIYGSSGTNYVAVQGFEFIGGTTFNSGLNVTGAHNYASYQNCRFNRCALSFTNNVSPGGGYCSATKCSFWGNWDTGGSGNAQGLFAGFTDNLYLQDCVFVHCGWKIGAARSDSVASGGPAFLGHGDYITAHDTNVHIDRIVYVDSARDGFNARGATAATCIVSWDEPVAGQIGGFSGSTTEAPNGVLITVDDFMAMGGDSLAGGVPFGEGFGNQNTISGSYVKNAAMFDNPYIGTGNNQYLSAQAFDGTQVHQYILMDTIRGYNYANLLEGSHGSFSSLVSTTWANSILDVSAPGTGNSVWSGGTFPLAKTRDQVATTLLTNISVTPGASYTARKAQLVNLMCYRPDVQWAPLLQWIGLPAYGLTPTKTTSPTSPNLSAETPATVY